MGGSWISRPTPWPSPVDEGLGQTVTRQDVTTGPIELGADRTHAGLRHALLLRPVTASNSACCRSVGGPVT